MSNSITKYPIILVHGIMVKDFIFFKAFGRIEKYLKKSGYTVYTAITDGFGTVENNATQLKQFIELIMTEHNTDKVNIIAHSKGGLDSKYMIENLDMTSHVASLTTLCTPFKGSPMASYLLKCPHRLLKFAAFWTNLWYRILNDKHPDSLTVCEQLQLHPTVELTELPQSIYCQSYSATMNRRRDDILMLVPFSLIRRYAKEASDGLVTLESSKYGVYRGDCLPESTSHSQIIGFASNKKKRRRIYSFYLNLAEELAQMGF